MAEPAKKEAQQATPAADPKAKPTAVKGAAAAAPPKKKDFLVLAMLGLVVVNFVILAGLGFFLKKLLVQVKELQDRPPIAAEIEPQEPEHLGSELQPKELGILFPLEGFLVNLGGGQGPKFLQVQMELELSDAAVEEEITRKKAAIRDAIIVLLSSKTYDELRHPQGIKRLRQDLVGTVRNLLTTGTIKDIYFTQFHFN